MKEQDLEDLRIKGYCILRDWVSVEWIQSIRAVLPLVFEKHNEIRIKNGNGIVSEGVALNALASEDLFIEFLEEMVVRGLINDLEKGYFRTECILNSFSALNNIASENKLFHKKVHRDTKIYSGDIPLMINLLVMLDDFTVENGATLLLPYSHLHREEPTSRFFKANSIHAVGSTGDIVIWNSNVFHASGVNTTDKVRRGLPITFTLPQHKQLLDYPKALGLAKAETVSDKVKHLLGYSSASPNSVSEWYRPDKNFNNY